MRMPFLRFAVALTALAAAALPVALPTPAVAQGFTFEVGGLVATAPKYEGSKTYEAIGAPLIFPSDAGPLSPRDGLFQFKGLDDVRIRLLNQSGFEAGPVLGYRFGRDQNDDARLRGTGDIDGGLVVGAYAGYRIGTLFPFVSYNQQVTGDDTGALIRLGLESKQLINPSLLVSATVGATWANADYVDHFFSVTAVQSARSGLARYDAEAGFKDVYLSVGADYALDSKWTLKLMGKYSHLLGDVADSPIVETEHQFFAGVGLTYKFTFGN